MNRGVVNAPVNFYLSLHKVNLSINLVAYEESFYPFIFIIVMFYISFS